MPNNKKLLDIIRAQEQSRDLHETFHSLLDRAEDPFSLVADYFGRGVFKKLTVITDSDKSLLTPTKFEEPKLNYGPGAEARLRLNEGKSSISGTTRHLMCHLTREDQHQIDAYYFSASFFFHRKSGTSTSWTRRAHADNGRALPGFREVGRVLVVVGGEHNGERLVDAARQFREGFAGADQTGSYFEQRHAQVVTDRKALRPTEDPDRAVESIRGRLRRNQESFRQRR